MAFLQAMREADTQKFPLVIISRRPMMAGEKPTRMSIPKVTPPGLELDAHGNPIPLPERTSVNRAKAIGSEAVKPTADDAASEENDHAPR
jgi:hypothetical protein